MSRENFVKYYTVWLRQPENKAYADKVDAITNEAEFGEFVLSQQDESGLQFTKEEVAEVMEASVQKARDEAGVTIGDLAQASELANEEMGATAGGYSYNFSSFSTRSRTSPTVSIYSRPSTTNILEDQLKVHSTIMCCW